MRIIRTHEDIEAGLAGLVMLDARLEHVIDKAGPVPLRRTDPGYRGLANIIVSQMVSKASAAAIWNRMEASLGEISADAVLALDDEDCRRFGLSRAKADTLRRVAAAATAGEIDLDAICNEEAVKAIHELTAIKGIGRWTAEVYLLFAEGRTDIWPAGDLAVQIEIGRIMGHAERPSEKLTREIAEPWRPHRGAAAILAWHHYKAEMDVI